MFAITLHFMKLVSNLPFFKNIVKALKKEKLDPAYTTANQ